MSKGQRRPVTLKVRRLDPILALAGAVVVIDTIAPITITRVMRRNKLETYAGILWLIIHVSRRDG